MRIIQRSLESCGQDEGECECVTDVQILTDKVPYLEATLLGQSADGPSPTTARCSLRLVVSVLASEQCEGQQTGT